MTVFINLGGTIRAQSPRETLERLRPLLPRFGITRVAAQEGLGNLRIPVSVCYRPNSRSLSTSQGKGLTRELADISAIMESIELFHAERLPKAELVASVSEQRASGAAFLDPSTIHLHHSYSLYSDTESIGWMSFKNLHDGLPVWVPRNYISMDYADVKTEISMLGVRASSNGLASGNTIDEALVHALYELIERHCLAEANQESAERGFDRNLDENELREIPELKDLFKLLADSELKLTVRAVHNSMGIPVFSASVQGNSFLNLGAVEFHGSGAHFLPEVALARAVTEAIQSKVTMITGSRDIFYPWMYQNLEAATIKGVKIGRPSKASELIRWPDVPRPPAFLSFADVLKWTLGVLRSHGFQDLFYISHQCEEYGNLPVVRLICPSMKMDFE